MKYIPLRKCTRANLFRFKERKRFKVHEIPRVQPWDRYASSQDNS